MTNLRLRRAVQVDPMQLLLWCPDTIFSIIINDRISTVLHRIVCASKTVQSEITDLYLCNENLVRAGRVHVLGRPRLPPGQA